jgi:hypothetical protein
VCFRLWVLLFAMVIACVFPVGVVVSVRVFGVGGGPADLSWLDGMSRVSIGLDWIGGCRCWCCCLAGALA